MFRALIHQEIKTFVPSDIIFSVTMTEQNEHGDYASNIAFVLAKKEGKNPAEVAANMALKLRSGRLGEHIDRIDVAKPGFLNFFVKDKALTENLTTILSDPVARRNNDIGSGKTVIVEYFQLNIAKRPHVGHLRSAVIGDALKRMFRAAGYNVISDTHVGDWGTQFGILLLECSIRNLSLGYFHNMPDPFKEMERLYLEGNARIKEDPSLRDRAKEEFAKLERGDKNSRELWELMVLVSMKSLKNFAERLKLLPFEEHRGESAYEADMCSIVDYALKKTVAKKLDDGAIVVDLTSDGLDEAVLVKSDGASTYLLRDLATIQYRKKKWDFWKNLYVVDVRQSHVFRQLFRIAELLEFKGAHESEHVSFGFMKLPDGAISTRKGNTVSLEALLDETEQQARTVISQKNPDLASAGEVAKQVSLAALKYFDLSHHRASDIEFRSEKALSFDGNSGPYLQYTYARLLSIVQKAGYVFDRDTGNIGLFGSAEERFLAMHVARFYEAQEDALKDYAPHVLAHYLYQLAQSANEFYHFFPVIKEPDSQKKALRLALVAATAHTLKNGLYLLGIDSPEEM